MEKPKCYECIYRGELPGDAHSKCGNTKANVTGNPAGGRFSIALAWDVARIVWGKCDE